MLAPAAAFRSLIVPKNEKELAQTHPGCPGEAGAQVTAAAQADTGKSKQRKNYSWARLMMGVFKLDVLCCPGCGCRMRILCAINSPQAIQKILACLGLPTRVPPIALAKRDVADEFF